MLNVLDFYNNEDKIMKKITILCLFTCTLLSACNEIDINPQKPLNIPEVTGIKLQDFFVNSDVGLSRNDSNGYDQEAPEPLIVAAAATAERNCKLKTIAGKKYSICFDTSVNCPQDFADAFGALVNSGMPEPQARKVAKSGLASDCDITKLPN